MVALALAGCGKASLGDSSEGPTGDSELAADATPAAPDAALPIVPDASPPPVDATPVDTTPDAAPPPPTCAEVYGGATDFVLCLETDTTCSFNAFTNGGNCTQMCAAYGGSCVGALDNDYTNVCMAQGTDSCDDHRDNEICICSRPQ